MNYVNSVTIKDNTNWFLAPSQDKKFVNVEREKSILYRRENVHYCSSPTIDDKTCPAYLKVEYRASGIFHTYERTYNDIFEVYGEVGGLKELVFLGAMFLYAFYNSFWMSSFLRNKLVSFSNLRSLLEKSESTNTDTISTEPISTESSPLQTNKPGSPTLKKTINSGQVKAKLAGLQDAMDEMAESTLDACTLIQEINNWKILRHLIFKPEHLQLLPLASINIKKRELINNQDSLFPPSSEKNSLQQAIEVVAKRHKMNDQNIKNPDSSESSEDPFEQIQNSIDKLLIKNLPDFLEQVVNKCKVQEDFKHSSLKPSLDVNGGDINAESVRKSCSLDENAILGKITYHKPKLNREDDN